MPTTVGMNVQKFEAESPYLHYLIFVIRQLYTFRDGAREKSRGGVDKKMPTRN